MQTLLWIAVLVPLTVGFVAIARRLPPAVGLAGFLLIGPAAVLLHSTGGARPSFFSLLKVASVALGAAYVHALRLTRWSERPLGRALVPAILAANILEAVVAEAAEGKLVNAAAGVLLVVALPSPATVSVRGGGLRYPLGGLWVAGYTLWNFTFVYGRDSHGGTGAFAALAVVHLLSPLLASRGAADRYIEARAFALTPLAVLRVIVPHPPFVQLSPHWYSPTVAGALRLASLALAAAVALHAASRLRLPATSRAPAA